MAALKTLDQVDVQGRTVLVRADFNVPVADGRVTDRTRIQRGARTIRELMDAGAHVVVISHFGRPKGQHKPELSLQPVLGALREALGGAEVRFVGATVGETAQDAVRALEPGQVALLENVRFEPGEEAGDDAFADRIAALGEIFVNDAFSASHRAHASVAGVAKRLPAYAGRLMEEELRHLEAALDAPERPLMAVVGGAKVSTKLDLLGNLADKVDRLVIGGGMANTFLAALDHGVGSSLYEEGMLGTARTILRRAQQSECTVRLPEDVVVAPELAENAPTRTVAVDAVPADQMILDVGPKSAATLEEDLATCRTLVWNGPLGAFETPPFDAGTNRVAKRAAELTETGGLLSVAGGGDTVAALTHAGVVDRFSYVSSAGGAFLEWLEGRELPGIPPLYAEG
ncbi:phosphoglycerate kinase [Limimonas halophila]|uniref:Phosphoglycerate kinase n=1 Tax=Limimonas halophila TaxID=1082479 RepID=A0A1G7UBP3_9PROT|nr:phosphoglycerate kinase [Limimonas halophila]SDG45015.1 phosphoglycerate kinase [Limimonas halophila]